MDIYVASMYLLAVQGTLKSLLQHHSSKASILQRSAFFTVQLSHPYMTTGKTIALTRWTFVEPLNCLLQNPAWFLPPLWSIWNYPCPHCCVLLTFQNLLKFFSSSGHIYFVIGSYHPLITIMHFIPHPHNLAFTILFSVSMSFFGFVLYILHRCEII